MYEFAHPSMALKLCKPYPFSASYIEFLMTGTIMKYSNTPCLYTPMVKCSDILSDKSLGGLV